MKKTHQEIAEQKHNHFLKVVSPRVDKAIEAIYRVGSCGNRTVYEYSEMEMEKIFNALQEALEDARSNYSNRGKSKRTPFTLTPN